MADKILTVEALTTYFSTLSGRICAVDGVSFAIDRSETLGIVGESGCGKSVTARSVLRLVEFEGGEVSADDISFRPAQSKPLSILSLPHKSREMRAIRGGMISMIFQEPISSFNPVFTIGQQMIEVLRYHRGMAVAEARARSVEMLDRVKIPNASQRIDEYPHEFSGGMRQRAMIAMALLCDPELLIADEPTTALDVTVEAQILELLSEIQARTNMSTIMITHDMAVIAEMTDNVMVMYAGRQLEMSSTADLFADPLHPYTKALLRSIPTIGSNSDLFSIDGSVPSLLHLPAGCYFAPRCPNAMEHCHQMAPPTYEPATGHRVRCWLYGRPGDGTEVQPAPSVADVSSVRDQSLVVDERREGED